MVTGNPLSCTKLVHPIYYITHIVHAEENVLKTVYVPYGYVCLVNYAEADSLDEKLQREMGG